MSLLNYTGGLLYLSFYCIFFLCTTRKEAMMEVERYVEILHECTGISEVDIENDEEIGALSALTAMQRAVEEAVIKTEEDIIVGGNLGELLVNQNRKNNKTIESLRAEVERLKECEKIVRELAETDFSDDSSMQDIRDDARQWVKDNK